MILIIIALIYQRINVKKGGMVSAFFYKTNVSFGQSVKMLVKNYVAREVFTVYGVTVKIYVFQ